MDRLSPRATVDGRLIVAEFSTVSTALTTSIGPAGTRAGGTPGIVSPSTVAFWTHLPPPTPPPVRTITHASHLHSPFVPLLQHSHIPDWLDHGPPSPLSYWWWSSKTSSTSGDGKLPPLSHFLMRLVNKHSSATATSTPSCQPTRGCWSPPFSDPSPAG